MKSSTQRSVTFSAAHRALILSAFTSVFFTSVSAFAGGSSTRGGEDLYQCPDLHGVNTNTHVLGDLATLSLPITTNFFNGVKSEDLSKNLAVLMEKVDSSSVAQIETVQTQLIFTFTHDTLVPLTTGSEATYSHDNLPVPNDGLVNGYDIERNNELLACRSSLIAEQDFESGRVLINAELFAVLNPLETALVKLHEAYLRIGHQNGMELLDAEAFARKKVQNLFSNLVLTIETLAPAQETFGATAAAELVQYCVGESIFYTHNPSSYLGALETVSCIHESLAKLELSACSKEISARSTPTELEASVAACPLHLK